MQRRCGLQARRRAPLCRSVANRSSSVHDRRYRDKDKVPDRVQLVLPDVRPRDLVSDVVRIRRVRDRRECGHRSAQERARVRVLRLRRRPGVLWDVRLDRGSDMYHAV
jgi:hypothetical protein